MWRMDAPRVKGATWMGALEDGTVFQKLGHQRWTTVIADPTDTEDSYELIVEITRRCEDRMVMAGPVEFSIDRRTADNIRGDVNWNETDMVLMVGFDMALRAAK